MASAAISRRDALEWLSALGISLGGYAPAFAQGATCSSLASDLDAAAVRALGREYLSMHPSDAEVRAISGLLNGAAAAEEQVAQLRGSMHQDFVDGRIVNLSGWLLSLTEARVFAALSTCI